MSVDKDTLLCVRPCLFDTQIILLTVYVYARNKTLIWVSY